MKRKTKTESVKEYLEQGNSLTPAEAFERGWGMRLAWNEYHYRYGYKPIWYKICEI